MNICVTVNSKYMRYLYVMLQSLYENNKNNHIDLYVIQRDFTNSDKAIISNITEYYDNRVFFIWVDEHKFDGMPRYVGRRNDLSLEIYFRLLIPELLPSTLERVLMLDVDIIVNKDISELYNIDFEEHILAAAPNMCHNFIVREEWKKWYHAERTDWTHYNTGVLLWNLEKIRKLFPKEYIFRLAWKQNIEVETFEEELFNVEFGEKLIKKFSAEKWNYIVTYIDYIKQTNFTIYRSVDDIKRYCGIIHYATMNPWQQGVKNKYFSIWWEYAKKTDFYTQILEEAYIKAEKLIYNQNKYYLETNNIIDKQKKILKYVDVLLNEYQGGIIIKNLKRMHCTRIMIYGAGRVARCLYQVFEKSESIELIGFIDKYYKGSFFGKQTIGLKELKRYDKDIDLIIVSLGYWFDLIKEELKDFTKINILSIDDIIEEKTSTK